MNEVQVYLEALQAANRHGFGFLLAYGATWLVAAFLWWRFGPRVGAYAALFQGMAALPLALLLTDVGSDGEPPAHPTLSALSLYFSMGQLLVLPLAIVLMIKRAYLVVTALLAVVVAVHFVPYSWLYGTVTYVVLGVVIAIAVAVIMGLRNQSAEDSDVRSGMSVCLAVGLPLLVGGLITLAL